MALTINRSSIPTNSPTLRMADGSCSHKFNTCKYELYQDIVAIQFREICDFLSLSYVQVTRAAYILCSLFGAQISKIQI